ncbi:Autophagy protein 22 [Phlyctochytrium bullatum]|nr:Autophagy protein 22 [Phlyctochytrium bullatum]
MQEFADVAGDDAQSNSSDTALRPISMFISDENDIDPSAVTPKELRAWYCFGFASEGLTTLAFAVLVPIIIETMTSTNAFQTANLTLPCNRSEPGYSCKVNVGGSWVDTTSFFFYATTASTLLQLFLFIGMGALADHGSLRKSFLLGFSLASICFAILFLTVTSSSMYMYATALFVLSNICYSATYVFYNAWLPLLTRNHPEILALRAKIHTSFPVVSGMTLPTRTKSSSTLPAPTDPDILRTNRVDTPDPGAPSDTTPDPAPAPPKPREFTMEDLTTSTSRINTLLSSRAFFWNYVGGLLVLVLGAALALFIGDMSRYNLPDTYGAQAGVAFSAVWWAAFMWPVVRDLRPRPGPPVPKGEWWAMYSIKKIAKTIGKCWRLKNLFTFLIGWFIYSDSFNTLISVAILFAQTELRMPTPHLLLLTLLVVTTAGLGCLFWSHLQHLLHIPTPRLLLLQVTLYALLPLYGLLSALHPRLLRTTPELFAMGAWHGFLLGATQSTCRSLFAEMVPRGLESEFFALYVVTDRGSSWMGPLVVAALDDVTGNKRWAFGFVLASMVVPLGVFWGVDVEKGRREAEEFGRHEAEEAGRERWAGVGGGAGVGVALRKLSGGEEV